MTRWKCGSVVADDGYAESEVVVSSRVRANVVPTAAFVDVTIRAHHKTDRTEQVCLVETAWNENGYPCLSSGIRYRPYANESVLAECKAFHF